MPNVQPNALITMTIDGQEHHIRPDEYGFCELQEFFAEMAERTLRDDFDGATYGERQDAHRRAAQCYGISQLIWDARHHNQA